MAEIITAQSIIDRARAGKNVAVDNADIVRLFGIEGSPARNEAMNWASRNWLYCRPPFNVHDSEWIFWADRHLLI